MPMLLLTRRVGESLRIGEDITLTVIAIVAGQIRLSIEAPPEVKILRAELPPWSGSAPDTPTGVSEPRITRRKRRRTVIPE